MGGFHVLVNWVTFGAQTPRLCAEKQSNTYVALVLSQLPRNRMLLVNSQYKTFPKIEAEPLKVKNINGSGIIFCIPFLLRNQEIFWVYLRDFPQTTILENEAECIHILFSREWVVFEGQP
jgi:hypothetical protein